MCEKVNEEIGGESGIRTHGHLRTAGFQDRFLQPLGHLSTGKVIRALSTLSIIAYIAPVVNTILAGGVSTHGFYWVEGVQGGFASEGTPAGAGLCARPFPPNDTGLPADKPEESEPVGPSAQEAAHGDGPDAGPRFSARKAAVSAPAAGKVRYGLPQTSSAKGPHFRTASSRNRRRASVWVNSGMPSPSSTGAI